MHFRHLAMMHGTASTTLPWERFSVLLFGLGIVCYFAFNDPTVRSNLSRFSKKMSQPFAGVLAWKRTRIRTKKDKGYVSYWPLYFVAAWCVGMGAGISKLPKPNVVTEHNVAIVGKTDDGDFAFISDEERGGGAFRVCPTDKQEGIDADAILSQGIGYIADFATWQERGTCKSIVRSDWGFWFLTKQNRFTYRRINNAGTAEQMGSATDHSLNY